MAPDSELLAGVDRRAGPVGGAGDDQVLDLVVGRADMLPADQPADLLERDLGMDLVAFAVEG
ncbi:hypothetical protein NKI38_04530 [Mesorhizobium sp. M0621]|uniref:hypothetical protein n=1 Tax=Mesorhizobium sp. M0621 TaxID=2956974 RepID=UPI00333CA210